MSDYESDDNVSIDDHDFDDDVIGDYEREEIDINGHDRDEEDFNEEKLMDLSVAEELFDIEGTAKDDEEEDDGEVEEEEEEIKPKLRVVLKSQRKTYPIMTKFEYTYLISQRAIAIENDSPLMIPDTQLVHAIDIAREETHKGLNPIVIQRILPSKEIEEWSCSELRLPKTFE
jgi:DNA-directed RNA polymerase subunit K/omega